MTGYLGIRCKWVDVALNELVFSLITKIPSIKQPNKHQLTKLIFDSAKPPQKPPSKTLIPQTLERLAAFTPSSFLGGGVGRCAILWHHSIAADEAELSVQVAFR